MQGLSHAAMSNETISTQPHLRNQGAHTPCLCSIWVACIGNKCQHAEHSCTVIWVTRTSCQEQLTGDLIRKLLSLKHLQLAMSPAGIVLLIAPGTSLL